MAAVRRDATPKRRRWRAYIERFTGRTNVTDAITLEDAVPGWQLPLSELFESRVTARDESAAK
jgi:hypothetical protein